MTAVVLDLRLEADARLATAVRVRGYPVREVWTWESAAALLAGEPARLLLVQVALLSPPLSQRLIDLLAQHAQLRVLCVVPDADLALEVPHLVTLGAADEDDVLREVSSTLIQGYVPLQEELEGEDFAALTRAYAARLPLAAAAITSALDGARGGSMPLDVARYLAHRLRGTAAMFGFEAASAAAAQLEDGIASAFAKSEITPADLRRFGQTAQQLELAAQAALGVRTVQSPTGEVR